MAAKTQLKDRVTGEELYPIITKDCIPGTEIITTDNIPVIPNDENYGPDFSEQNVIEVIKFAERFEKANKVGFGFDIKPDTYAYIPESPSDDDICPIIEEKPNQFIHKYHIPVTDNVTDYTGALNLTTANYVQKLISKVEGFKLFTIPTNVISETNTLNRQITIPSSKLEECLNSQSYYIEVTTPKTSVPILKIYNTDIDRQITNMGGVKYIMHFKLKDKDNPDHHYITATIVSSSSDKVAYCTISDVIQIE